MCIQRLKNILRVIRGSKIGPATFHKFFRDHDSDEQVIEKIISSKEKYQLAKREQVEKEIIDTEQYGACIIPYYSKHYPRSLRLLPDFPPVITVRGNIDILHKDQNIIAIAGSRTASINSKNFTMDLVSKLSSEGYHIVSGLARGVDGVAHNSNLKFGTIAVMAGGIDHIYPREHNELYENIIKHDGCIISEKAFRAIPKPIYFPQRNRLIASLAIATVIIEAKKNSGSMVTARFARECGRKVYIAPGSIQNENFAGSNNIIKQGHGIILEDVRDILGGIDEIKREQPYDLYDSKNLKDCANRERNANKDFIYKYTHKSKVSDLEQDILDLLDEKGNTYDDLENHLEKYDSNLLGATLMRLEIDGLIYKTRNGIFLKKYFYNR